MKLKNFQQYLEKRLDKKEIADIEKQAELEFQYLQELQYAVADELSLYMGEKEIGFNELVRRLQCSPSQMTKMLKGQANLTLASVAHVFALLNKHPRLVFD